MTFVATLRQVAIAELLVSAGQQPIFSAWDAPGEHDAETCCNKMGKVIVRYYFIRAGKTLEDTFLHLCLCCFACSKFAVWHAAKEKLEFFKQISTLDRNYPGEKLDVLEFCL